MRLDADHIKHQIAALLLQCPELEEDEVLRADMIEGETDAITFLRRIELRRQEAVALAEAVKQQIETLTARKKRFENREFAMRELLFKIMEAADLKRYELPEATLSVRNGIPKVVIIDDAIIPDILRHPGQPNKTRIGELLRGGTLVQGACLSNATPILSIRTR